MTNFFKHEVVGEILEIGLLPVFYNKDTKVAENIVRACVDGGAKVIEFTNRGDLAYEVFSDLVKWSKKELPDVILGAGTILDTATADLFINCGANFIVGPIFNPDVAKICNRRKIVYIPGCMTPTLLSMGSIKAAQTNELKDSLIMFLGGGIVFGASGGLPRSTTDSSPAGSSTTIFAAFNSTNPS